MSTFAQREDEKFFKKHPSRCAYIRQPLEGDHSFGVGEKALGVFRVDRLPRRFDNIKGVGAAGAIVWLPLPEYDENESLDEQEALVLHALLYAVYQAPVNGIVEHDLDAGTSKTTISTMKPQTAH